MYSPLMIVYSTHFVAPLPRPHRFIAHPSPQKMGKKLDLNLLGAVLRSPFEKHPEALIPEPTIEVLLEAFELLPILVQTDSIGLPRAKNCVLHAVMFHVLGGCDAGV